MIAWYQTRSGGLGLVGWNLGAITAAEAVKQGAPNVTSTQATMILNWVGQGQMLNASGVPAYIPGSADCAAAGGSGTSQNVRLAQMAGGFALEGINVAAAVSTSVASAIGTALGPLTMGISTLIGIFPLLFGHHAAAVKKEQSVLCAAVPAANNYLQIIDQGVQSGIATPQQGIQALDSLLGDFTNAVRSIEKTCNAACVMEEGLHAIVLQKQSEYQDMAAAAAAAPPPQVVTSGRPNTTAPASAVPASSYASFYSSGMPMVAPAPAPGWLPILAIAGIGWLVLRGGL